MMDRLNCYYHDENQVLKFQQKQLLSQFNTKSTSFSTHAPSIEYTRLDEKDESYSRLYGLCPRQLYGLCDKLGSSISGVRMILFQGIQTESTPVTFLKSQELPSRHNGTPLTANESCVSGISNWILIDRQCICSLFERRFQHEELQINGFLSLRIVVDWFICFNDCNDDPISVMVIVITFAKELLNFCQVCRLCSLNSLLLHLSFFPTTNYCFI